MIQINVPRGHVPFSAPSTLFEGRVMTGGESFYLLVVLASFVVFAVVLAYQAVQQSRGGAEFPASAHARDTGESAHHA